jgi:mannose-6-phosphate isomerase-like protein (cupin superfamily)
MKLGLGLAAAIVFGLSFVYAQQPDAPAPAPAGRAGSGRGGPAGGRGAGPASQLVWSPKATKPGGWTAPMKPHTKLADVLAKHKGQADWVEPIVDDETLHADYISMSPGKKTPKRMNADTVEWWIVQDGQIRFDIDGQEPILASKGYMVQVPYRNMYTMETVGDRPSLRFEVNIARARKMYAMEETPVPLPGNTYVAARIAGRGKYEGGNKPFVDFNAVVAGTDRTREFVVDRDGYANIILGRGIPPPALTDKGHFHQESSEFWLIMLGQIRYNIEGVPDVFVADQGDVVYVPKQHWHLASFAGDGMSCRLAMNAFSDLGHSFEAPK